MFRHSVYRDNAFTILSGEIDDLEWIGSEPLHSDDSAFADNNHFSSQFIFSEITTVQSALRRIARSSYSGSLSLSSPFRGDDIPQAKLISNLSRLRSLLFNVKNISTLDPLLFLSPFLDVIRAKETAGPVTCIALSSIEKFLKYGVISQNSPKVGLAVNVLTLAVTHCKFEATDSVTDEVVLFKIMNVLRLCISCNLGHLLTDESVCQIMETSFSLCFQPRLSELVRRSAEHTLNCVVQKVFSRLEEFAENQINNGLSPRPIDVIVMSARPSPVREKEKETILNDQEKETTEDIPPEVQTKAEELGITNSIEQPGNEEKTDQNEVVDESNRKHPELDVPESPESDKESFPSINVPYGIPSILEILRVLISLLNLSDITISDTMRMVSLSLLTCAIEQMGNRKYGYSGASEGQELSKESLKFKLLKCYGIKGSQSPDLSGSMKNRSTEVLSEDVLKRLPPLKQLLVHNEDLLKSVFQILARTDENLPLFFLALKMCITLFTMFREYYLVQLEWFLGFIVDQLSTGTSVSERPLSSNTGSTTLATNESKNDLLLQGANVDTTTGRSSPSLEALQLNFDQEIKNQTLLHSRRRISESPSAMEVKELLMDTLLQFLCIPGFMFDLYINYDADYNSRSIYEDIIKLLCKNIFRENDSSTHVTQCLDALIHFLGQLQITPCKKTNQIVSNTYTSPSTQNEEDSSPLPSPSSKNYQRTGHFVRFNISLTDSFDGGCLPDIQKNDGIANFADAEKLVEKLFRKKLLLEGTGIFNDNIKKGLAFFQENGFLPEPVGPKAMASFLYSNQKLNKKLLGEYLSKPSNIEILKEFIKLFDFKKKRIDEALRVILEAFRLPGEAQQIERIMENFAGTYFQAIEDDEFRDIDNQDSAFVLSFSVIMINTDQHNPNLKRRMTFEDYSKNLRGLNNGQDFRLEYLKQIYDAIKKDEIVMPEEHVGELGFNYTWKQMMIRARTTSTLKVCRNPELYSRHLFLMISNSILNTFANAYSKSTQYESWDRLLKGFQICAHLAFINGHSHVLDKIITHLAALSGLGEGGGIFPSDEEDYYTDNHYVHVQEDDHSYTNVSGINTFAVKFGRYFKGQLAAILMFNLTRDYGNLLRIGWTSILQCVKTLFIHNLLEKDLMEVEDFVKEKFVISYQLPERRVKNRDMGQNSSFLSVFSSYLMPYSPDVKSREEPTRAEKIAISNTKQCIIACKISELFYDLRFLGEISMTHLTKALLNISEIRKAKENATGHSIYNPSSILFFELLCSVTLRNRDRIKILWPSLAEAVNTILSESNLFHGILIERAVVGLLRLAKRLSHHEELMEEIFDSLRLTLTLPKTLFNGIAESLMAGLCSILETDSSCFNTCNRFNALFALLSRTSTHLKAAHFSFIIVQHVFTDPSKQELITVDNYAECVDLLVSFAGAAGMKFPNNAPSKESLERGLRSIDFLFKLNVRASILYHQSKLQPEIAWSTYWFPILNGLTQQYYNPSREIRQHALSYLQRALLLPEVIIPQPEAFSFMYNKVLFPLLESLIHVDHITTIDRHGMDEMRLRASALLCKTYLHYMHRMQDWEEFPNLWCKILDMLEVYMKTEDSDLLIDSIPESLKNMLLVMFTSGIFESKGIELPQHDGDFQALSPPVEDGKSKERFNLLWKLTWKKVNRFLPRLKSELFPGIEETIPIKASKPIEEKKVVKEEIKEHELNDSPTAAESSKSTSKPLLHSDDNSKGIIEKITENQGLLDPPRVSSPLIPHRMI